MQLYTVGIQHNQGKIVHIKCVDNDCLKDIRIKNRSFLLLLIEEGSASFLVGNTTVIAVAPCFVCFDEKQNPILLEKENLKCNSIYFHPQFININMRLEFIRQPGYFDFAFNHDLFLLEPFLCENYVVPILFEYENRIKESYKKIIYNLEIQPDILWSCRARSYFMELVIILERLNDINRSKHNKEQENEYEECLKRVLGFIENNYSENITLGDLIREGKTNHTTLGELFQKEFNMPPIRYLWNYRICIAKKHLAFTDIPLKEIAFRCGFKTVSHFSRVFKEHTGKPPLVYRKTSVEERKRDIAKS